MAKRLPAESGPDKGEAIDPSRIRAARATAEHFLTVLEHGAPDGAQLHRVVAILEAARAHLDGSAPGRDVPTRRVRKAIRKLDLARKSGGEPEFLARICADDEARSDRPDCLAGIPVASWAAAIQAWKGYRAEVRPAHRPRADAPKGSSYSWAAVVFALLQAGKGLTGAKTAATMERSYEKATRHTKKLAPSKVLVPRK